MDLKPAITSLYQIYQTIKTAKTVKPGFGLFQELYKTKSGRSGIFICILSPPTQRTKKKRKSYEKVIEKSRDKNRLIEPHDFEEIRTYLNNIFHSIIKPREKICELISQYLACLRLGFVPLHNMKYSFKDLNNPQITIYSNVDKAQFYFYLNIVELEENGLYLAHEKQIKYIKSEMENGVNPNYVQNLPPLRTGDTHLEFKQNQSSGDADESEALQEFRNKIKQKKIESQKHEEMALETVIQFNKPSKKAQKPTGFKMTPFGAPIPIDGEKNKVKAEPTGSAPVEPQPPVINPSPRNLPKPEPMPIHDIKDHLPEIKIQSTQLDNHITGQLQSKINNVQEENVNLKNQLTQVTDMLTLQLQQKNKELTDLKSKISILTLKQKTFDDEKNRALIRNTQELQQKLESYERIIKTLETERELLKTRDPNKDQGGTDDLKRKIQNLERTLFSTRRENELLAKSLKNNEKNLENLKHNNKVLIDEKLSLELLLTELNSELTDLRTDVENLK
jgi:hypothetical protein